MWQPKQADPFIAIMVGIDKQYNVRLPDLFVEALSFLWRCRGIDNCSRNIPRASEGWGDRNLREDGLDLAGNEGIFDKRGDQTRFPCTLVAAYADTNYLKSTLYGSRCIEKLPIVMFCHLEV